MLTHSNCQWIVTGLCLAVLAGLAGPAVAQESASAPLARELAKLLEQHKLNTVAAKEPAGEDAYVAAMYFSNSQLLVVAARYAVPMYVNEKLSRKDYMEVYIDLNSASVAGSKVFVSDLQANGLLAKPEEGQPFDTYESGGKSVPFDRNWKKQNLSEEDYMKLFADADARYAKMLTVLLAELKGK
jgi:hypothetical protein